VEVVTASEIGARILKRIDDDVTSPGSVAPDPTDPSAPPPEILAAINEGQELFALLTLCLETTATLTLTASAPFATLRGAFPGFLCPLRLSIAGTRVRPATLADLDAENDAWQSTPGTPARYCTLGFNFYAVTPQPVTNTAASLTYARSPVQLVGDSFPEIPEQYHQSLVKYGMYRVRLKEGGQALQRGMVQLNEFLDDATAHGEFVRARSRAARYDVLPFELKLFDRSRLIETLKKEKAPWQPPSAA
jgi:hypothetical protein